MDKIMNFLKGAKPMEQTLKLDDVIVDNDLNPREGALDQDVVLDYSAHIDDLPPMTAFDVQGFYYLVGGFHRYAAHRLALRDTGRFVVHQGDRNEAKEFADLDNLKHGLRLNRAERRRVIERQLKRHPEWSDVRIATACYTTDKTVRSVREALEENSEIPRLDVLVGADGIERPRTVSKPAREEAGPAPGGFKAAGGAFVLEEPAMESTQPISPALLRPVEEMEERYAITSEPTSEPAPWEMTPEREAEGLAKLEADLRAAEPRTEEDDDAGESLADETEVEEQDGDDASEADAAQAKSELPSGLPVSLPSPSAADPQPAPPAPVLPPPPPPAVGPALWRVALTYKPGGPSPLCSMVCGDEPRGSLPADVAAALIRAIEMRTEAEAPAVEPVIEEVKDVPVATPDWLVAK